jgi:hypothetical protein
VEIKFFGLPPDLENNASLYVVVKSTLFVHCGHSAESPWPTSFALFQVLVHDFKPPHELFGRGGTLREKHF